MYQLLIVDDEEKIAEGIANLFPWNQIGFEVVYFHKGGQVLEYIEEHSVDVVMSDIEMPDMDGIELCRRLIGKNIKVVFFSSYQRYDFFRYAIQFQVEDYLLKPIKSGDILNCFSKIKEKLDQEHAVEDVVPTYYEQIILTVKNYVKESYRDVSLEGAALLVNLSPSYLSRLFKDKCGYGFFDYVTKIRMNKACELLDDFQYKTYDIAHYIGYDNPKNFSRAFKAHIGKTPTEYRNRGQGRLREDD